MHRSLSRRAIAVVALLLVAFGAAVVVLSSPHAVARPHSRPRPSPVPVDVDGAVRRTAAQPAARLHLDLTSPAGARVTIAGVAGLASDDADLSVAVAGRPGGPVLVRIVGDRAWIGGRGLPWTPMPAAAVGAASPAMSWREVLRRLQADPQSPGGVALAGHPATLDLDAQGRIRRLRATLPASTFDLRLDGYDEDLRIVPPP